MKQLPAGISMARPFENVRVLDLSDRLSGAFAARLFGDYGADVILAEPPQGHPLRAEPPFLDNQPGPERSALHAYANWNKRSLVVDAPERLADLISDADVIITTADPIGIAPFAPAFSDVLASRRADSVHLSITPHGLTGPLAGRPGNNLTASARSGWSYINGYKDEPPLQMPGRQSGYIGGVAGYIAAAAALRRRDHGDSELVDISEVEAFALTVHPWGIAAIYEGIGWSRGPSGGRVRGEPGPLYSAADGQMHFGFGDFHNWTDAMQVLQLPELGEQPNLIPDWGRHSQDLTGVVAGTASQLQSLERWPVFHALAQLRCVVGCVQTIDDIVNDSQLAARGFLIETQIEGRPVRTAGAPAKLSPSPWQFKQSAPRLNAHASALRGEPPRPTRVGQKPAPLSAAALAEGPLSGVRVLSFAQAWSGTFGTEILALLGADVVQLGALHRIDVWRNVRQRVPKALTDASRTQHAANTQGLYNSVNLNKRELTLDLRSKRGMELFWDLVPGFDILAENFRPTVLPAWGITLDTLQAKRPGMILASISGYGTEGPYREYPANGATTEPMSSLSSLHGYEGDPGMNTGGLYPDPVAGYFWAASVLAALHQRDQSGEPQRIDLAMLEAVATVCGDAITEYDATGSMPRPGGNHHPRIAPHNNFEARDGEWLALAAESDEAWRALATHMGLADLVTDPRFRSMADRKAHEVALDEILATWCLRQDVNEAEEALCAIGVAAARVVPLYELYSRPDPYFVEAGFVSRIDHPEAGPTWLPGRPWRFSAAPSSPLRPSPCVGEHSREILREELGIHDDEYEALVEAGITGTLDDKVRLASD
jgi:crotonobetainyl-CoA:carnitine CoA-transferase CaiB-like acyl-CoA transferase